MISSLKFNQQQLGKRKKVFDSDIGRCDGRYRQFIDYKKMTSHEFATFQQKKEERLKSLIIYILTILLTITILLILGII